MPNFLSLIQSMKTVDSWTDVINANINGSVRTGYKTSELSFSGSGASLDGSAQIAEGNLIAGHSTLDFSQGAITGADSPTQIAIQGNGYFTVVDPNSVNTTTGAVNITGTSNVLMTRDGDFRANAQGLLVNASGYYLVAGDVQTTPGQFTPGNFRTVYDDVEIGTDAPAAMTNALNFSDFLSNSLTSGTVMANGASTLGSNNYSALVKVAQGQQSLEFSQQGSTVFDAGFTASGAVAPSLRVVAGTNADATIVSQSLEASNASMTQAVPELGISQRLFSALTKVMSIANQNQDAILGVIK